MTRKPPKAYRLNDWDVGTQVITYGIVRCPEGDEVTFRRLALQLARQELDGDDPEAYGWRLRAPVWRWWRINPDFTGEYSWLLGEAAGPGRGNWQGALVQFAAPETVPG